MARSQPVSSAAAPAAGQVRRLVHQLRTEGSTPARDAVAIGAGVFIGCSPWYGFHLALCWVLGRLLRLNRLKMYLAANVSNPVVAPFLILSELQVGAWMRRGAPHAWTIDTVRTTDPWIFGIDILLGSIVVGSVLGIGAGLVTWLGTRERERDSLFSMLVARASDRYVSSSITAWEFARGKMRGDPLYRTVLRDGLLPAGGALVDIGCGQGLMLALLTEAAAAWRSGEWPSKQSPPIFDALIGIESRRRVAAIAQQALSPGATIIVGDARMHVPERCRAVLFFDVLHMMPADDQNRLLRRIASVLEPGGVILVREADAASGWRFEAVRAGNRLKAVLFGNWGQTFHFRPAEEWRRLFTEAGFNVREFTAGEGTPFANVLFTLTREPRASALNRRP